MLKLSVWGSMVWGSGMVGMGVIFLIAGIACSSSSSTLVMLWEGFSQFSHPLSFCLLVDAESCFFSGTVCMIAGSVLYFSVYYMSGEVFMYRFTSIVLIFVGSMLLLIISPGVLSIFVGWDGLGVSSFLLVIYFFSDKSLNAGLLTLLTNRLGDVFLLLSVTSAWGSFGGEFTSLKESGFGLDSILITGIFAASMTKSAQIPFSAWLPAAMAAPTPVSSLVHSSTLVTAGLYLLIRFSPGLEGSNCWSWGVFISSITLIMASLSSLVEMDMKKIVALSTLSQLGLMGMAVSLQIMSGAFFHLVMHAYFKALLFMMMGYWIHQSGGYQDLRIASISSQEFKVSLAVTLLALMSLSGVPFFSGFFSKDFLLESSSMLAEVSTSSFVLMVVACVLTVCYSGRLVVSLLGFNQSGESLANWSEKSGIFWVSLSGLSVLSVGGGVWLGDYLCDVSSAVLVPGELKIFLSSILGMGLILSYGLSSSASYLAPKLSSVGNLWGLSFLSFPSFGKLGLSLGNVGRESEDLWVFSFSSEWLEATFLEVGKQVGGMSLKSYTMFSNLTILGVAALGGLLWAY